MIKLQKVKKRTQIEVKIGVFKVDSKSWLGADLNLVNWNIPILAYHVILSNGMTERKQKLLHSQFKKTFLNDHDNACWDATTKSIITNKVMKRNLSKKISNKINIFKNNNSNRTLLDITDLLLLLQT